MAPAGRFALLLPRLRARRRRLPESLRVQGSAPAAAVQLRLEASALWRLPLLGAGGALWRRSRRRALSRAVESFEHANASCPPRGARGRRGVRAVAAR